MVSKILFDVSVSLVVKNYNETEISSTLREDKGG